MPTDVAGIPLLPLIALIGGILVLIKADILNWVVAIFMIGFGVLGILPAVGVDLGITNDEVVQQIEELRTGDGDGDGAAATE